MPFCLLLHFLEEQHYREYASEKFKFLFQPVCPEKTNLYDKLIITRKTDITSQFFFYKKDISFLKFLFICPHWVLVVARGIFRWGAWASL